MFLQVCVCPRQRGCYPSMHCRWYPSMPCSRSPGWWYPSMPCSFLAHTQGGSLGGSGQGGLQAHTQGRSWGGSGPGPQPRGKLRGIWSRPTPKGEVERDLARGVPAPGGVGGACSRGVSAPLGVSALGGTCSWRGGVCSGGGGGGDPLWWLLLRAVRILLECILVIRNFSNRIPYLAYYKCH